MTELSYGVVLAHPGLYHMQACAERRTALAPLGLHRRWSPFYPPPLPRARAPQLPHAPTPTRPTTCLPINQTPCPNPP
jgi:hypothetical protein